MPSWQAHLLKIFFRLRRITKPGAGILDIDKSRSELEALAAKFKTKIELDCTAVEIKKIPAEWISTPEASDDSVILYLHGGSYHSGSINSHRSLAANIGDSAGARVLIIDYRLAPENPYPAAVEDTLTAYQWLLENQYSPDRIALVGDSAGGGLVLSLLVNLRDRNQPLPAAAVCLSPWTDLTCSGESWKTNAHRDIMLDPKSALESAKLYLRETDPRTPLASPLYADLKGLPPILIQVGTDEVIFSDAENFAKKAHAAKVDLILDMWDGMQHEWHFAANFMPEGQHAIERIGRFIWRHIK